MTKAKWYDSDNPGEIQRGLFRSGLFWTIAIIVAGGVISIALWGFGVFTSDVKGRGDAIRTKNSALNRIGAQERFEDLYAQVKAADQKVEIAWEALQSDPKDPTLQQNYSGTRNYCVSVVADYDANARKYTQEEFRSSDLPYQIDAEDSATDCAKGA